MVQELLGAPTTTSLKFSLRIMKLQRIDSVMDRWCSEWCAVIQMDYNASKLSVTLREKWHRIWCCRKQQLLRELEEHRAALEQPFPAEERCVVHQKINNPKNEQRPTVSFLWLSCHILHLFPFKWQSEKNKPWCQKEKKAACNTITCQFRIF